MKYDDRLFDNSASNPDERLCRYMSFPRLMNLLTARRLYLPRIDLFNDPLEGHWPREDVVYFGKSNSGVGADEDDAREMLSDARSKAYASCWTKFTSESDAHWRLYSADADCVAVVTNVGKLKSIFEAWNLGSEATFGFGLVRYVSHLTDSLARETDSGGYRKTVLRMFTLKNVSFKWEEEVRAVVLPRSQSWPSGIEAPIDPATLIEQVIVGPMAAPWFHRTVEDCAGAFGLKGRVVRSELATTREVLRIK